MLTYIWYIYVWYAYMIDVYDMCMVYSGIWIYCMVMYDFMMKFWFQGSVGVKKIVATGYRNPMGARQTSPLAHSCCLQATVITLW